MLVAVVAFAAVIRLWGLGREPLDPREASRSIAAWWTVEAPAEDLARLAPPADSAALLGVDVALFWLTDPSGDALARLGPSLAGIAIVLFAWGLGSRSWSFVLPAALLLAVDPWLVAASRRASGAILAAGAAIAAYLLLRRLLAAAPTAAVASTARRAWDEWAVAIGLLVVAGPSTFDFLAPVLLAAVIAASGTALRGSPRPRVARLVGVCASIALLAATTGLLQWRGPGLVTSAFESWLASWSAPLADRSMFDLAHVSRAVLPYQLALVVLAIGGLVSTWRREDHRQEAWTLAVWIGWGLLMQLRGGRGQDVWLALEVPLLLAAALALEPVIEAMDRGTAGRARRIAIATFATLAIGAAFAGTTLYGASESLPAARRLAGDLTTLIARPVAERPRIEVATGPAVDGVLAWYLREVQPQWVSSPSDGSDGAPRVVVTMVARAIDQAPEESSAPRYTLRVRNDGILEVELR